LVNTRALANEEFKVAGELMASSLAQNGPAPCLFARNVYDYCARGICSIHSYNWLEHVEDESLKLEIEKVCKLVAICLINRFSQFGIQNQIFGIPWISGYLL
jgi:hypothetical protein